MQLSAPLASLRKVFTFDAERQVNLQRAITQSAPVVASHAPRARPFIRVRVEWEKLH